MTFSDFCNLYYDVAKEMAKKEMNKAKGRLGAIDIHVDEDYVIDEVVLIALEKTHKNYDSNRGKEVTALLATIVRNELSDTLKKENKAAAKKQTIENVEVLMKDFITSQANAVGRDELIKRLYEAIGKLNEGERIIIENYLEDKRNYIVQSAKDLCISENYVSVRKNRILEKLYKMLKEYEDLFYNYSEADTSILVDSCQIPQLEYRMSSSKHMYVGELLQEPASVPVYGGKNMRNYDLALKFLTRL